MGDTSEPWTDDKPRVGGGKVPGTYCALDTLDARDTGESENSNIPEVKGKNVLRILPNVGDTDEPENDDLPGVEGNNVLWKLPGVRDTGEPEDDDTPTWPAGKYCILGTPQCARHRRARVISPGVEGEDIFRIIPGVRDTGEQGLFLPGVEGEDIFQILLGERDTGEQGLFLPRVEGEDVFGARFIFT